MRWALEVLEKAVWALIMEKMVSRPSLIIKSIVDKKNLDRLAYAVSALSEDS